MDKVIEECLHMGGFRVVGSSEFLCPGCEERLDLEGVTRWVREAERARDELYSLVEVDEFGGIALEESQREVYRRRKILYELQSVPRISAVVQPEMILVVYDEQADAYEARIFYKEPRPVWGPERVRVEATTERILELNSRGDPNIRLVSEKVGEFHALRSDLAGKGALVPNRRVFYASEF